MTDNFISFENEPPELIHYLEFLLEQSYKNSKIIPLLLENDGGIFDITYELKQDLVGFKKLIEIDVPPKDKEIILDKVNSFKLRLPDNEDDDFFEYTSEWKPSDYSVEENKVLEKRVGYFGMLRHMLMHHKLDTLILPFKEDPTIITFQDLSFSDDFLDRMGFDLAGEVANDISKPIFQMLFIFHPNERLSSNSVEAKRNLEKLETLDELGEFTNLLYKSLDFIRKYTETSAFRHENLIHFLNGESVPVTKSKGYKSLIKRVGELMKTSISNKEICRIIEEENERNNWISEKEAFNILMEKLGKTFWNYTPVQRQIMDKTIKELGVENRNPEKVKKMISILHDKRPSTYFWEEPFFANLKDLGIWGSIKEESNLDKWFSIIEFIRKNYETPNCTFEKLYDYMKVKYKKSPKTAFEKLYFDFIEELKEKQVPLKQRFKEILKAHGDRFILPDNLFRFFKGMDKIKNIDEVKKQDLGDIDYVFRMLGAEDGINVVFDAVEKRQEETLEKMEHELEPALKKIHAKKKLSAKAKQKLKKRKRKGKK